MGLPNQFNDIIQAHLNVFAAWVPIVNKYKLGDYGVFSDGVFSKLGNITEEFQVSFTEGSGEEASIDFTSEGARVIQANAGAGVSVGGNGNVDAKVEIEFTKERSLMIKSPVITVTTIENVNEVARKLKETGKWDGQWKVVYQVYNAQDAVIVSTIEAGTKLGFSGDATAIQQMKLGSAGINIDTNRTLGLKINGKNGVIGLGLFRIKSPIFGGKKVKVEVLVTEGIGEGEDEAIKLNGKVAVKDDI